MTDFDEDQAMKVVDEEKGRSRSSSVSKIDEDDDNDGVDVDTERRRSSSVHFTGEDEHINEECHQCCTHEDGITNVDDVEEIAAKGFDMEERRRSSSVRFNEVTDEHVCEESHQCIGDNDNETAKKKKTSCPCHSESHHHPQPSLWHIACTKCLTKVRWGKRPSLKWKLDSIFDTYKTFEVKNDNCYDLVVTVHRGENITKGSSFKDSWDTPDPYIILRIPQLKINTPKRTITEEDSTNPIWNQTFHFYLYKKPRQSYEMEINLMDENVLIDEAIDKQRFPLDCLEEGIPKDCTFTFKGNSKVYMTFLKQKNTKTDLRFSMSLCDEEKNYLRNRRKKVFESMKTFLGEEGPLHENEVPTIGILGSGGGFRAMIGLSGVLKALQESEILDCITYLSGLSGSTWCISTLYCDTLNVKEFQQNLRESVGKKWEWNILKMPQYVAEMLSNYWKGQSNSPISLVDIFGHLIGDQLLGKEKKNRMRLSHLNSSIAEGEAPFPLFAGLHATERSSEEFSDWIEFSPYEIGMGKYGTFMKTEHFGSKFLAGKLMKKYSERPLHYLQAIWGSAFTINLKKHLMGSKSSATEDVDEFTYARQGLDDEEDSASEVDSDDSEDDMEDVDGRITHMNLKKPSVDKEKSCTSSERSFLIKWTFWAFCTFFLIWISSEWTSLVTWFWTFWAVWTSWLTWTSWTSRKNSSSGGKKKNWVVSALENVGIDSSYLLNIRAVKPGRIYNPFRGLNLKYNFANEEAPEIDTTDSMEDGSVKFAHGCKFQPLSKESKRISVMDSGFAFNSPYPVLLRPQRGVDLFLSFDFSQRTKDLTVDESAFKQLVKAEKWAQERHIPFPPVKEKIDEYLGTELQECYVFESPDDCHVPVILHFPLVNNKFRQYKSPGVSRSTEEEFEFSKFPCFGDGSEFSTFKFNYDSIEFDRLAKVMEFNTLLHKDTIIQTIKKAIITKREGAPLGLSQIAKILLWHKRNEN